MKNHHSFVAATLIAASVALPTNSVQAEPWGIRMFGMDFGQSTGPAEYYGYPGAGGPWGWRMFGMDFGQSVAPVGFVPPPMGQSLEPIAPVTSEEL
jgi:hypothetical protein